MRGMRGTLAGFIFPGGSDHINWEFIMWAYAGRVYCCLFVCVYSISFIPNNYDTNNSSI
jgi:hypothetical protein